MDNDGLCCPIRPKKKTNQINVGPRWLYQHKEIESIEFCCVFFYVSIKTAIDLMAVDRPFAELYIYKLETL